MEAAMMTLGERVRYPKHYFLYIVLAAVDVLMTWVLLQHGATEINAIAAGVIEWAGGPGMAAYKFALVALVLVICEVVSREKPGMGRGLAVTAVLISLVPPAFAGAQWVGVFEIG